MAALLAFAFASGVITILSPCILPVLPIVLSGSVGGGRARPLGIVAGFVASFAAFTLALTAIVQALGVSPDALRIAAVVILSLFGLVLVVPALQGAFERAASRVSALAGAGRGGRRGGGAGFWGGVPVGASLGLVWTPCVGPIMASAITLALTQQVDGGAVLITLAYTLGTALPMLAVMMGGRALLARVPALASRGPVIQKGFGVLLIAAGLGIGLGWDRQFQAWVLRAFPGYGAGLTAIENAEPVARALEARAAASGIEAPQQRFARQPAGGAISDYGAAPQLVASGSWLNAGDPPAGMEALRGKVVLIDFWTYSCINCVRTIPYLREWHRRYADQGLVIIGVHTPEFEFEKSAANLERAIRDLGVEWPVVQDNDYAQWRAYGNRFWPAKYFVDASGRVRYFHFGEGAYEESEGVITRLLQEAGTLASQEPPPAAGALQPGWDPDTTPETYLGWARSPGPAGAELVRDQAAAYSRAGRPAPGEWSLSGTWTVAREYIVPASAGTLELGFRARKVFLVVEPTAGAAGGRIEVRVDSGVSADTADVRAGVVEPRESRLYELVDLEEAGEHVLSLKVEAGLRLFAFTFG